MPTITGTLNLTTGPATLGKPFVPPLQAGIPPLYTKGVLPVLPDGLNAFSQKQQQRIVDALGSVLLMLPQAATAAPKTLIDGMRRLARGPWRPVAGVVVDAWVYWDAAGQTWRLLSTNPTNTG